jgi:hypothetical protein
MDDRSRHERWFVAALALTWAVFATAVYVPDIGRGFVKDDFRWVDAGRATLARPAAAFLRPRSDFYRPIVELTFAAEYAAHRLRPRGYGFTNLALYVGCIAGLWTLCRALTLSPPASAAASLVWAANPHGINMAVVWISGRTSLCLTLFALLAAVALIKRRYVWMSVCLAAALGSKEEAVLLPIGLFAWHRLLSKADADSTGEYWIDWRLIAALGLPLLGYSGLRVHSGAMTLASAPSFYHLTFTPSLVAQNAFQYGDRAATAALITLVLAAAAWRIVPALGSRQRRLLAACAVWMVCGYSVTLFVPVRSSLYAVFPSAGAAIACGVVLDAMMAQMATRRFALARLAVVFGVTLLALVPAYRTRNGRYVEPARFSARALRALAPQAASAPEGTTIVLHDVDDPTSSFVGAFGGFATEAVSMHAGHDVRVWIDLPPDGSQSARQRPPRPDQIHATFAVERGRIFRIGP